MRYRRMMYPRNIWIKNREREARSAPVRFVSFHNPDQRGRGLVHLFPGWLPASWQRNPTGGIEGKNETETGEYPVSTLALPFEMLAEHTLEGRLEDVSQRLRGQGGNRRQTIRGALQF